MLADVGTLPGGPPPPYRQWERTSYLAIYETAKELFDVCEIKKAKVGWATVSHADLFGECSLASGSSKTVMSTAQSMISSKFMLTCHGATVGNQLGVFFWATGSEKDRSVPIG